MMISVGVVKVVVVGLTVGVMNTTRFFFYSLAFLMYLICMVSFIFQRDAAQ